MAGRIARIDRLPIVIVVVSASMVLVHRQAVMVFAMIVIGVGVDVQRRRLAAGREKRSEQDGGKATHRG